MKKIIIIALLAIIAAVSSLAAWQTGERQTDDSARQTLHDFRKETPYESPNLSPAAQKKILSAVFSSYLEDEKGCKFINTSDLEAARKAGLFTPAVKDIVTGSFTAAGERQTAYLILVGECNYTHATSYGSKRLAVFSGEKLVADADTNFRSSVLRISDLNNDGVNELLLSAFDMNQGVEVEVATLVEFSRGQLRILKDFGMTSENSCNSGLSGIDMKASVISYAPAAQGKMPEFRVDNYRAECTDNPAEAKWSFLSTGPLPEQ